MKAVTYLFLLILTAACGTLDVQPFQQLSDSRAITDAGSARAALLGTYSSVQNYYQLNYPVLGYLPGDNVRFNGTLNQFNQIDQNALSADNVIITETWTQIYQAINSANNVLAALPDLSDPLLTATEKNQLLGEAYFIRALAYFDLGRGWGGVPLVLKPTRSVADGQGIKRSTLEQTYDQVLADLTEAERLLLDGATRNRAVKNTARALRARLHLYRGQWAEAETFATQVIASPNYRLATPYRAFSAAPFGSSESVFELTYSIADPNNQWNNWYPSALGGQYTLQPTPEFVTLANRADAGGNRNVLLSTVRSGATDFVYGNLYNRAAQRDDPAYVIRLAELYLIRSEARARQGKLTDALTDLNVIRSRAGVPAGTAATANALLLAVENERRVEFAFEADRWFDLVRTGRADDVLGITDQRKWLFPIPFNDIAADADLTQNPGY
ncbi:RagB/SusD family nutrient uptake outer membrane protein [Spirosoma rigui]|uniref:RagB/SusD family nutrient uptake outer membrane protein n=1 Tax=Spirosoma rigui TaxID=564064 RepID=UPI0009B11B69|nr:RagB/SusD family nutrient uptake outer membrane protein [Spirosoma rigui]